MLWARISYFLVFILHCMVSYRGAGVYAVDVVDAFADGPDFDEADTHFDGD